MPAPSPLSLASPAALPAALSALSAAACPQRRLLCPGKRAWRLLGVVLLAGLALGATRPAPAWAQGRDDALHGYLRGGYISIMAAAGIPYLSGVENKSSGTLSGYSVSETERMDGVVFSPSVILGYDVGRLVNMPVRAEVEYTIHGKSEYRNAPYLEGLANSDIQAVIENQTFMANVLVDIEAGWRLKPFLGAGLGLSWNEGEAFQMTSSGTNSERINHTSQNIAWSLIAGAAYPFAEGWSLDLRYRYLDAGEVQFGPTMLDSTNQAQLNGDYAFHEIGFGFRYQF